MKVLPSFTSKYKYSKTDEERKYNMLKDTYKSAEAISSAGLTYGVLETIDKFILTKNQAGKTADEIAKLAKKHTKRNILIALGAGVLGYIIAWPYYKKLEPFNLRIQEWADKQNRIAEKAEQLVKEEDAAKKQS